MYELLKVRIVILRIPSFEKDIDIFYKVSLFLISKQLLPRVHIHMYMSSRLWTTVTVWESCTVTLNPTMWWSTTSWERWVVPYIVVYSLISIFTLSPSIFTFSLTLFILVCSFLYILSDFKTSLILKVSRYNFSDTFKPINPWCSWVRRLLAAKPQACVAYSHHNILSCNLSTRLLDISNLMLDDKKFPQQCQFKPVVSSLFQNSLMII